MINLFSRENPKEKGGKLGSRRQEVTLMLNNTAFPRRVYLSPEEWSEVLANPRQRDTERHAVRADHLRTPHPIHAIVNMAVLPDGRRYKLDGHTRGYLWEKGDVEPPAVLIVDTWDCESIDQVTELYSCFDNSNAVETVRDRMFGAYREQKFTFKSSLLSARKITSAIRHSYQVLFGAKLGDDTSEYDLLRYWKPELILLDECEPTQKTFPTSVTATALLTFRRYGRDASDFWERYAAGRGNKFEDTRDAVQALSDRVESMRGHRKLASGSNVVSLIAVALSAFQADREGRSYTGGIKPLGKEAIAEFAAAAKATKRTWE